MFERLLADRRLRWEVGLEELLERKAISVTQLMRDRPRDRLLKEYLAQRAKARKAGVTPSV